MDTPQTIHALWQRLDAINTLHFIAKPGAQSRVQWHGSGYGQVTAQRTAHACLFEESGQFLPHAGHKSLSFHNIYQWHYCDDNRITLSHARYDRASPTLLFDITAHNGELACTQPHLCGEDVYHARINLSAHGFAMDWQITGPRKDEHLHYVYASVP